MLGDGLCERDGDCIERTHADAAQAYVTFFGRQVHHSEDGSVGLPECKEGFRHGQGRLPTRGLRPVPCDQLAHLGSFVHHSLGKDADGMFDVLEVLVEGRWRRPSLTRDVDHLHRTPRGTGNEIHDGGQEPLSGRATSKPSHPPVGRGDRSALR
jgi:hypothetical protein